MLRARWVVHGVLATGAVGVTLTACSDQHSLGPERALMTPTIGFLRTVGDCPAEVPPEDCRPITTQERSDLYWAIHDHVRWGVPACAEVGNLMKDYTFSLQDLRVWPNAAYPADWGRWRGVPGTGPTIRISINDLMFGQGWSAERAKTAMHEGYHAFHYSVDEDLAENFAQACIDN